MKTSVLITHDFPGTTEITGVVNGREVIKIDNHIAGTWNVASSICLPSNINEAQAIAAVFSQAFEVLRSFQDQPQSA